MKREALSLSLVLNSVCMFLLSTVGKGQSFVHTRKSEREFSASRSFAAKQVSVGPAEVPVEGGIQDGVQGRVKVAQPQDDRVKRVRGVRLLLHANAGEVGEVREPADDKGPQHSGQSHGGFVLARYGCSRRYAR